MSIQSEINRINSDKENLITALKEKGIKIADGATLGDISINIENTEVGVGTDTSDATAKATDILAGKTAYVDGEKITGTIVSQAAQTITPGTTDKTIASGKYLTGTQTIKGDANLVAANIVKGKSIFGVEGSAENGGGGTVVNDVSKAIIEGTITEINDASITKVRNYAFYSCPSLTSVNFPVCTNIGSYAFSRCTSLTSVNFPVCTTIDSYAFSRCTSLTSVNFPVCTTIGSYAFYECFKLTSVNFPACTTIGSYAFIYCSNLTSVNFPVCTNIGSSAFNYCSSLTSVNFPVCTNIENYAFGACSSLTSVNFPACTTIGSYAFIYCPNLTSVNLPLCSYIGNSAFYRCVSLTSLTLGHSSIVTLYNINTFASTPMSVSTLTGSFGSIYVPASLVDAYKVATNWAAYADRITAIPVITFYIGTDPFEAEEGMTWEEWVNSNYNTCACRIQPNGTILSLLFDRYIATNIVIQDDTDYVYSSDIIVSTQQYYCGI